MRYPLMESRGLRLLARCFLAVTLLACMAGCSGTDLKQFYFGDLFGDKSSKTDKAAEQLVVEGMEKMQKKKYGDALKAFQQLKERYPYSKYTILAELKIADANFYKKEYSDAAIAYEEFARLHPRNEVVPYVMYQVAMCHFLSFSTIDRDNEETRLAMTAFQRVVQAYPDSEYAMKASKQLFECQKRVVAHEYYVGEFYYKRENYRSAKERLDKINNAYPEAVKALGYDDSLAEMVRKCEKHIGEGEKKPSIFTRIGL
jgi:outer membrane protein assembly factor BamD